MATLEDKILGEKLHNYCSSSDDSENESDLEKSSNKQANAAQEDASRNLPEVNKWEGTSTNTGPKGVIKDWQRFKQLENEKRVEDDKEKIALMKKLTLSVQTALDEEKEKAARDDDPDLAELLNDDFLLSYQKQRMQEMLKQTKHNKKFAKVLHLIDSQQFLDAIDKEDSSVTIVIHIYEDQVEACQSMNKSFQQLCKIYEQVKFCTILSSKAGMSKRFKVEGVPAVLVYKAGQLVGNFIRLSNELGDNFQAEDVQSFLVEHGMLEDKSLTPVLIRSASQDTDDSD